MEKWEVKPMTKKGITQLVRKQRMLEDKNQKTFGWVVIGVINKGKEPKTYLVTEDTYKEIEADKRFGAKLVVQVDSYDKYRHTMGYKTQQEVIDNVYKYSKAWEVGMSNKLKQ